MLGCGCHLGTRSVFILVPIFGGKAEFWRTSNRVSLTFSTACSHNPRLFNTFSVTDLAESTLRCNKTATTGGQQAKGVIKHVRAWCIACVWQLYKIACSGQTHDVMCFTAYRDRSFLSV